MGSDVLFDRPLDKHRMMFAIGGTHAHLNRLAEQGRGERRLTTILAADVDGYSRPCVTSSKRRCAHCTTAVRLSPV